MKGLTMKLMMSQESQILDSKHLKMQCKTDFENILKQVHVSHRENQLSDQHFRFLLSALVAQYVACLVETGFESKMAKWSDRLLSHWAGY